MARKRRNRHTLWVIFTSPERRGGPGNQYVGKDGKRTELASLAAKFHTWNAAKQFADQHDIEIKDTFPYIAQRDFLESEL